MKYSNVVHQLKLSTNSGQIELLDKPTYPFISQEVMNYCFRPRLVIDQFELLIEFCRPQRREWESRAMPVCRRVSGRVGTTDEEVRKYIMQEFDDLLADESFTEQIPWHLHPDASNQARASFVIEKMRKLAGL